MNPPSNIAIHRYGQTDLVVPTLGLGAGQLGDPALPDTDADRLLACALDAGVVLVDTAPSYGVSEARIGRFLRGRRDRVVLSTKFGYGVAGIPDWIGPCITAGVEQALRVLGTDRIDLAHLHSCPRAVLERGDVTEALDRAKQAGKLRAIAYSGENEDLVFALGDARFDGFMASLNLCDQRVIDEALPRLAGRGFIAKRPTANHPWRFAKRPVGDYSEEYWLRWQRLALDPQGLPWGELALRFALSVPGVSSAIVGTARIAHLREAIAWAARGPLPPDQVDAIRARFRACDDDWRGQV